MPPSDLAYPSSTHNRHAKSLNVKAHLHRLIHSSKPVQHHHRSQSSSSSEDENTVIRQSRHTPQLVYEHELVDGVVSDAECGEVCVVLEVGVARVVGVERRGWWEVGVVDLDLGSMERDGDERGGRWAREEEEIGRAF